MVYNIIVSTVLQTNLGNILYNQSGYSAFPKFFESPRETTSGLKNWVVQEISGKITVFDRKKGNHFWSEFSGG